MVLEGDRSKAYEISAYDAHRRNSFKFLGHADLFTNLLKYDRNTKFLNVRHPFSRLISAFRNKISGETPRITQDRSFTDVALHIVHKYRKGARAKDFNVTTLRVTWDEWIQYLTDPDELSRFDPHWREMYKLSLPCLVNYDLIAKLETVESDMEFLLDFLGLKHFHFPTFRPPYHRDGEDKVDLIQLYFGNMSTRHLQRLYDVYKLDFELFGYEKPVWLSL